MVFFAALLAAITKAAIGIVGTWFAGEEIDWKGVLVDSAVSFVIALALHPMVIYHLVGVKPPPIFGNQVPTAVITTVFTSALTLWRAIFKQVFGGFKQF